MYVYLFNYCILLTNKFNSHSKITSSLIKILKTIQYANKKIKNLIPQNKQIYNKHCNTYIYIYIYTTWEKPIAIQSLTVNILV